MPSPQLLFLSLLPPLAVALPFVFLCFVVRLFWLELSGTKGAVDIQVALLGLVFDTRMLRGGWKRSRGQEVVPRGGLALFPCPDSPDQRLISNSNERSFFLSRSFLSK